MKNRTRIDYIKPIRILSIAAYVFIVFSIILTAITGLGLYSLGSGIFIYIVILMVQYKMLYKCRCKKCGHIEIFQKKRFRIIGIADRCPNCNAKLSETEKIE